MLKAVPAGCEGALVATIFGSLTVNRLRTLAARARLAVFPVTVPDYPTSPGSGDQVGWFLQLERVRVTLELGREAIAAGGWTQGAWFEVGSAVGETRPVEPADAYGLLRSRGSVAGACLVGTLLQLAEDPDRPTSVADVWRCVDELYEAVHERMGHTARPAGLAYPHETRRAHLGMLTRWNDAPGRTREQVLDLFDRAIGRTILGSCAVPAGV